MLVALPRPTSLSHTRYDGMIHGFIRMTALLNRSAETVAQTADKVRQALTEESLRPAAVRAALTTGENI